MIEKRASIDIGTNTTHLLIADVDTDKMQHIARFKKRHFIYLAESGIRVIPLVAKERLLRALDDFSHLISAEKVSRVLIAGTEALRKASNGMEIIDEIKSRFGWNVEIITGFQEAIYVYTAVKASNDLSAGNHLIVDIGGGSTEFIVSKNGAIDQIFSCPVGIARLYNLFHKTEPIFPDDVRRLNAHLDKELGDLQKVLSTMTSPPTLLGCAGTFEIFDEFIVTRPINISTFEVSAADFKEYRAKIVSMTLAQRLASPVIPQARAPYITVALLLIDYLVRLLKAQNFLVSKYSLKEGIILS